MKKIVVMTVKLTVFEAETVTATMLVAVTIIKVITTVEMIMIMIKAL